MINSILIANRGEIALRIIKTCKRLGIRTIAIGSISEIGHPHLVHADKYEIIDKESPLDVYLDQELIIKIAKKNKVQAIHPGYGFLAENFEFCMAIKKAGLIFIGPEPETLKILGDKAQTRILAQAHNVPVVPGYNEKNQKSLFVEAKKIGFPIMLKAVMGGGGRGMRKVDTENDFLKELESAQKEAKRLYSNQEICIEKFIEKPRHIEIQVARDKLGNTLHFFERDCSIQRRFQKVIEFTPANIEQKTLEKLYSNALIIAQASNLSNLATMEFLVSSNQVFFLEANPRIQVEHPVTEIACEIDLIELQIKIASGESIKTIKPEKKSFSLQARIYAEAPEREFISTSGQVRESNLPYYEKSFCLENSHRFDHALFKGFEINQNFDPMLCKILVSAKNYDELRKNALEALSNLYLTGIETNASLLIELIKNNSIFNFTIQDLESFKADFEFHEIAAIFVLLIEQQNKSYSSFNTGFRNIGIKSKKEQKLFISENKKTLQVTAIINDKITINNKEIKAKLELIKEEKELIHYRLILKNKSYRLISASKIFSDNYKININGKSYIVEKIAKKNKLNDRTNKGELLSPLPGKVTKVNVKVGQNVAHGETLIKIESMKIEHTIRNEGEANKIESIHIKEGTTVNFEELLLKFAKK